MNNEVIYKEADDHESKNCLKLLLKYYKNYNLSKQSIEWEHYRNPFGKPKIYIAQYRNELIGQIINIPFKFQDHEKTYGGFRTQDLITDTQLIRKEIRSGLKIPRKNGLGICSNLMSISNVFLDKNDFAIGFPNEKSLPFCERSQWDTSCDIPLFIKNIDRESNCKLKYELIDEFKDIHKEIWQKNIGNKVDIFRSKEYLNWRYFLNPKAKYKVFEIKNNFKSIGYIVLKKHLLENNIMIGHICEFVCEDEYINDVIQFSISYFSSLSIRKFTMWEMDSEKLFLKNFGFKNIVLKNRKFTRRGKKKTMKKDWRLSMSYSDVY